MCLLQAKERTVEMVTTRVSYGLFQALSLSCAEHPLTHNQTFEADMLLTASLSLAGGRQ